MRDSTYKIALGGILSASALALMFFGSFIPFGTFAVPAAASLMIAVIDEETSHGFALGVYFCVAVLSVLIAADKEAAALFLCFFGYYPVVRSVLEKKLKKPLAFAVKSVVFLGSVSACYYLLANVFIVGSVRDEFLSYSLPYMLVLLGMGYIVFMLLDAALARFLILYRYKLRAVFRGKR